MWQTVSPETKARLTTGFFLGVSMKVRDININTKMGRKNILIRPDATHGSDTLELKKENETRLESLK